MVTLKELVDKEEIVYPGNAACQGCPATLGLRFLGKALGKNIVLVIPASCSSIIQGPYPYSALKVPVLNIAFAASAATASGIWRAFKKKGRRNVQVIVWAGDGGTFDIGLQALSGAAERNENILYICYDNEAYMNTGIQRSSATPPGAWTTTTVTGKKEYKKDLALMLVTQGVPYVATASLAYPFDFIEKLRKASRIEGFKFIHLHAPCPPGWGFPPEKLIEISRLAVLTGMWILYEAEYGRLKLTGPSRHLLSKSRRKPVVEYLKMQKRFRHLKPEDYERIQNYVDYMWDRLKGLLEGSDGS
mgnify:CR=1 FL=1